MKSYPHKPKVSQLQELLVEYRRRYQSSVARVSNLNTEDNWYLLQAMWVEAINVAALEYALDGSSDTVKQYWQASCNYAERLLQLGRPFGTNMFRITLALANLLSRDTTRELLEKLERPTFVNPDVICDGLDILSAELMGDLSAERVESAHNRLALAEKRVSNDSLPRHVHEIFVPLVHIESAIMRRDIHDLDTALSEEVDSHRRWYSPPDMRITPTGLIDYAGLGLLKIARRRGLQTSVSSVYLPQEYL
jgi:hypothetical protein